MNSFYYYGKLPSYGEFYGSSPDTLLFFLNKWAVKLNTDHLVFPGKEHVLFILPNLSYQNFWVGICWNSKDCHGRSYPFSIYTKVEIQKKITFFLSFFESEIFIKKMSALWKTLATMEFSKLEKDLTPHRNIAKLDGNKLFTAEDFSPYILLESKTALRNIVCYFSLKKQLPQLMAKVFEMAKEREHKNRIISICNPKCKTPCFFVTRQRGSFCRCFQK